jgi:hypothetical protein
MDDARLEAMQDKAETSIYEHDNSCNQHQSTP